MRYWLAVLAATLTACGGDGSSSSPAQPVEDTTPPVITLNGDNPQLIEAGEAYAELGAAASDNLDGDLSASIVIDASAVNASIPGDYTVNYEVRDAAGNTGTATRTVTVQDTTPPVITLLGDEPQVIVTGDPYMELGGTAVDSLDGDLTAAIVIDATAVDTTKAGDYSVTYDVRDAAGNSATTITRVVRVQNPPLPAAPTASVEGEIKQLIFSWDAVTGAAYYRLLENADGHSGFTQVGDDIPAGTLAATRDIAVHLFDWVEAQYLVEACNIGGCNSSSVITATNVMLDTIGYFKASNTESNDHFGRMVALSGDGKTLAVGAPLEDSSAIGINGDQTDNSVSDAGAVYVFRLAGELWSQQAYIKASNTGMDDYFGSAVALSGDGNTMAIGAGPGNTVHMFQYDGDSWSQQASIKGSNSGDSFGSSLALSASGDLLLVGAPREDSSAIGINGDQTDNSSSSAGAAYLYQFDGSALVQRAYIKASNTERDDRFGVSVSLSADGNTLAVGATGEDSRATGVDGDQYDDGEYLNIGAAYLFRFDGTSWFQEAYMKASNPEAGDAFGASIILSADGNTLAVGATGEDSWASGVNGDQYDDREALGFGAVYLFKHDGISWYQQAYMKASNNDWPVGIDGDRFGGSLAMSADGNVLAVGTRYEDSIAVGVNGDQYADDQVGNSGAVYVFRFDGSSWSQRAFVKASNTGNGEPGTGCDPRHPDLCDGPGDEFGASVALSAAGTTLAVAAELEDSSATGVGGDQADNTAALAGAAYIY
jgi:hypothetical protein